MEPTEVSSRRSRLRYLVLEGGQIVLRANFDRRITSLRISLTSFLNGNKPTIKNLKTRRIITESQFNVLYPKSGDSSSENYDVTLLVALHRSLLCGKPSNDQIWDPTIQPLVNDLSEEADIVRLRNFRNELCHPLKGSGPIKVDFETMWDDITEVLMRLCSATPDVKCKIENLKTNSIDTVYEQTMTRILEQWVEQDIAFGDKVIKTVLTHSLLDRSKKELKDVLGEHFVETRLFQRAQKMLEDEGIVVLKGAQGEGKTTISKKLVKDPDTCLKVNAPEEWSFCSNARVDTVIVDDMFGSAMFDKAECRKWLKHLPVMIDGVKKKRLKVIITSRSYILEEVLEKMYVSHLISDKNTLTISSKDLDDDEKQKILKSHMQLNGIDVDKNLIAECVERSNEPSSYIIGFPECARLFCNEKILFNQKGEFFESPMAHISTCLVHAFKSDSTYLAFFVLWAQTSKQLKLRDLEQSVEFTPEPILRAVKQLQCHPNDSLSTIRKSLFRHKKDFIKYNEEKEIFQFNHRVLSDAVGLVVHRKNRTALLNYCDAPFIDRYISIERPVENTDRTVMGITVMPGRYDQLCSRIGSLILKGTGEETEESAPEQYLNCTLLLHPAFRSEEFCAAFFKTMSQRQMLLKILTAPVSTIGTSLMTFKDIIEKRIFETEIGVLAYALKQSLKRFASICFLEMKRLITETKNADVEKRMQMDVSMTLLVAILNGDTSQIEFLVGKMEAQADDMLIHAAIKRADSGVLNLLLDRSGKSLGHYSRNDKSPLIIYVEEKNITAVECILSSMNNDDNEINHQSDDGKNTALHIACNLGHQESVKLLLSKNPDLQIRNAQQQCPIHVAALADNIDTVRLLLKHNIKQTDYPVDLNGSLKGMKLYHIAVMKKEEKLLELLVELGVSAACVDGRDQTPLVFALHGGKCELIDLLVNESIKHKAHTIPDSKGNTALHAAVEKLPNLKSEESMHVYQKVITKLSAVCDQSIFVNRQEKTALQLANAMFLARTEQFETRRKECELLQSVVTKLQENGNGRSEETP